MLLWKAWTENCAIRKFSCGTFRFSNLDFFLNFSQYQSSTWKLTRWCHHEGICYKSAEIFHTNELLRLSATLCDVRCIQCSQNSRKTFLFCFIYFLLFNRLICIRGQLKVGFAFSVAYISWYYVLLLILVIWPMPAIYLTDKYTKTHP